MADELELEWFEPLEDTGRHPPEGEIDRLRWKTGVIKERYGIDIQFAEYSFGLVDGEEGLVWKIGEGHPIFCKRDRFYMFLEGVHVGAAQHLASE